MFGLRFTWCISGHICGKFYGNFDRSVSLNLVPRVYRISISIGGQWSRGIVLYASGRKDVAPLRSCSSSAIFIQACKFRAIFPIINCRSRTIVIHKCRSKNIFL